MLINKQVFFFNDYEVVVDIFNVVKLFINLLDNVLVMLFFMLLDNEFFIALVVVDDVRHYVFSPSVLHLDHQECYVVCQSYSQQWLIDGE